MNSKDFGKHPVDLLISILICFCILFMAFISESEYPYKYEILDYRRVFFAVKISGFMTLYFVIAYVLFNDRAKEMIHSIIRYFLIVFYVFLLFYSCNNINIR